MFMAFFKTRKFLISLITVLIFAIAGYYSFTNRIHAEYEIPELISDTFPEIHAPNLLYGLDEDSFYIEEGRVKRNQNLSDILSSRGVSYQDIDRLARNTKKVFDVRYIKAGNNYTLFYTPDTLKNPKYFVYEDSKTDYFVFDLDSSSLNVIPGVKDVVTERKTATGVIETSLWNALIDNSQNTLLANRLSDIYQWSIDFFAIQKGDRYKIMYDEEFVNGESVGVGTIYSVLFQHMGEDYFAFWFNQPVKDENGEEIDHFDYFDEKGKSLKKAFLKAPLKFSRISSRFSNSRLHPVLRIRRPHHGVDYAAPTGTEVYSIGEGIVVERGYQRGGGGNYVKIKHNSVYRTSYMHLSRFAKGIRPGVRVKQGDVIGYVGSTGLASGPHLDFRVYKNGHPVDPLKVKAPPVEPVSEENTPRFEVVRDSYINELATILFESEEPEPVAGNSSVNP